MHQKKSKKSKTTNKKILHDQVRTITKEDFLQEFNIKDKKKHHPNGISIERMKYVINLGSNFFFAFSIQQFEGLLQKADYFWDFIEFLGKSEIKKKIEKHLNNTKGYQCKAYLDFFDTFLAQLNEIWGKFNKDNDKSAIQQFQNYCIKDYESQSVCELVLRTYLQIKAEILNVQRPPMTQNLFTFENKLPNENDFELIPKVIPIRLYIQEYDKQKREIAKKLRIGEKQNAIFSLSFFHVKEDCWYTIKKKEKGNPLLESQISINISESQTIEANKIIEQETNEKNIETMNKICTEICSKCSLHYSKDSLFFNSETCKHRFCKDCLLQQYNSISKELDLFNCPSANCNNKIEQTSILKEIANSNPEDDQVIIDKSVCQLCKAEKPTQFENKCNSKFCKQCIDSKYLVSFKNRKMMCPQAGCSGSIAYQDFKKIFRKKLDFNEKKSQHLILFPDETLDKQAENEEEEYEIEIPVEEQEEKSNEGSQKRKNSKEIVRNKSKSFEAKTQIQRNETKIVLETEQKCDFCACRITDHQDLAVIKECGHVLCRRCMENQPVSLPNNSISCPVHVCKSKVLTKELNSFSMEQKECNVCKSNASQLIAIEDCNHKICRKCAEKIVIQSPLTCPVLTCTQAIDKGQIRKKFPSPKPREIDLVKENTRCEECKKEQKLDELFKNLKCGHKLCNKCLQHSISTRKEVTCLAKNCFSKIDKEQYNLWKQRLAVEEIFNKKQIKKEKDETQSDEKPRNIEEEEKKAEKSEPMDIEELPQPAKITQNEQKPKIVEVKGLQICGKCRTTYYNSSIVFANSNCKHIYCKKCLEFKKIDKCLVDECKAQVDLSKLKSFLDNLDIFPKKEKEAIKIEEETKSQNKSNKFDSTWKCQGCLIEYETDLLMKTPCHHLQCGNCVGKELTMGHRKGSICCPFKNCKNQWSQKDVETQLEEWALKQSEKDKLMLVEIELPCYNCKKNEKIEIGENAEQYKCSNCSEVNCLKHKCRGEECMCVCKKCKNLTEQVQSDLQSLRRVCQKCKWIQCIICNCVVCNCEKKEISKKMTCAICSGTFENQSILKANGLETCLVCWRKAAKEKKKQNPREIILEDG